MTNEELLQAFKDSQIGWGGRNMFDEKEVCDILNMLRKEGTKVWVSWDSKQNDTPPFIKGIDSNPYISSGGQPEAQDIGDGRISWTRLGECEQITKIDSDLAALLGVKPGECKAFYIKEADDGDN